LINKEEVPRLGRNALIDLVEWVKRHRNEIDESNGTEITPQPISSYSLAKANDFEKVAFDTQGDNQ
jgi:hypothetical protein